MWRLRCCIAGIICAILPLTVYGHNGNDGWVTIERFILWSNTYNNPQIRISIVGDSVYNPAGCADADSYMVATELPQAVQDRIYSTLLAAVMAGKRVTLRLDNAPGRCELTRPKVLNVRIETP